VCTLGCVALSHANETKKETALQITSTAENSTKDWTAAYAYIEDIRDGRGYTGGLVGFTTATSDMLHLTRQYIAEQAGNTLAPYLSGLEACAERGETVDDAEYGVYGGGASDIAAQRLGQPFLAAWADAANRDPVFRKVQRDLRDSMYWAPALAAATADGVGFLGLALYYDTSVNHGPVGFQNAALVPDQRFQAAASYSLMSPPRIGRRRIRPWTGSGTGASGRGVRSCSERCGRFVL
jgi:hypothetical protein